jgi:hypothetical protein
MCSQLGDQFAKELNDYFIWLMMTGGVIVFGPRTRLPRGNIFPIMSYVDYNGVEYKFDSGRYSYDDHIKMLLRDKWRKSDKIKLLKGFTIMSQSRGAVKIDLTKLKQQLGIFNWWL